MDYDTWAHGRKEQVEREHHAEAARMRREARVAFGKAAREMRRTVPAVAQFVPIPERIDRAVRVLDSSGVFLSRVDIERLAREVADDYCGVTRRGEG